jgi:hypothetical protein
MNFNFKQKNVNFGFNKNNVPQNVRKFIQLNCTQIRKM